VSLKLFEWKALSHAGPWFADTRAEGKSLRAGEDIENSKVPKCTKTYKDTDPFLSCMNNSNLN
jgi:hypothetical protein